MQPMRDRNLRPAYFMLQLEGPHIPLPSNPCCQHLHNLVLLVTNARRQSAAAAGRRRHVRYSEYGIPNGVQVGCQQWCSNAGAKH